ncbi:hypothetical protein, partial [Vogesella mureinivorans]|uniref:hypothetical protein n=1 Tax=Vogesella mureinivorans TaxID=657276 RepID=UPI00198010F7
TIERVLAIRQDTDLRNQGEFLAETHEDAFDRLTMIVQRLAGYLGMGQDGTLRTLLLGTGDVDGAGAFRARGNRIRDLADPVDDSDAATRGWALDSLKTYQLTTNAITTSGFLSGTPDWPSVPSAAGGGNVSDTMNAQALALLKMSLLLNAKSVRSIYDFANPVLNGTADDSAALQFALNVAPEGTVLRWKGPLRIATPVICTRRVGIIHESPLDCVLVDVGLGHIGFSYEGPASGINDVTIHVNAYGKPNCADHAVKLSRIDRSTNIYINVYAGTAQHAAILAGCLINKMAINSSANFLPPYAGMGFQAKHIRCMKALGVAFNNNLAWVNLEGGGEGILGDNMNSEGNNTFYGCIEGLASGRPMDLTGWMLPVVRDLHFEANAMAPIFRSCTQPTIGPNVLHALEGKPIEFENCLQPSIDGYYGEYKFDDNCTSPHVGRVLAMSYASQQGEGYFMSAEASAAPAWIGSADLSYGGPGSFQLENLFHNPFVDIWDNGPSTVPAGCSTNGTVVVEEIAYPLPVYTDNDGIGRSARVSVGSVDVTDGIFLQCKYPYNKGRHGGHFMSATVAVRVATGQPDVIVFIFANGQLYDIGRVSVKDQWVLVRGSARVSDGQNVSVLVKPWNFSGGGSMAGQFYLGGCSIVKGNRPAKFIGDNGKRREHVVDNVSWPPAFVGQEAFVPGTGKWYKAKGTTASSDWVLLN